MSKEYLFIGEHAETLASGRRIAPGEEVPASAVNPDDPADQRLIADGLLRGGKAIEEKETSK